ETVVLAAPEKSNTASAFVIGDLPLVNTLVVENTTDERWVSALKEKGVAVIASQ
ncbi:DeoR family transcriptional regulator, partial [Enterobacter hormaechei]